MYITPADLAPFATIDPAKAAAMIADAEAEVRILVPGIKDLMFSEFDALKAILRRAIIRWNAAGDGAVTQQGLPGGFTWTTDNRLEQKSLFLPEEVAALKALTTSISSSQAWSYSLAPKVV